MFSYNSHADHGDTADEPNGAGLGRPAVGGISGKEIRDRPTDHNQADQYDTEAYKADETEWSNGERGNGIHAEVKQLAGGELTDSFMSVEHVEVAADLAETQGA